MRARKPERADQRSRAGARLRAAPAVQGIAGTRRFRHAERPPGGSADGRNLPRRSFMNRHRALGLLFVAFVAAMLSYAFSPRRAAPLPATEIRIEQMLTLAAAQAGERLVAAGERGQVFASADGGRHWQAVATPVAATLTALSFADDRRGVAVGHDAVILLSTDGGASWREVSSAPEAGAPLLAVRLLADGRGFALGAYGSMMTSHDGGESWEEAVASADDRHLNAIAVFTDDTLVLAGEAGLLLRSDDGGAHWEELDSPYNGSFFGLQILADEVLLAYGMRGHIFRSADRGESWEEVDSTTEAALFASAMLADGRVVLTGQGGTVLLGDAAGRVFRAVDSGGTGVYAALLAQGDAVLLFGEGGVSRLAMGGEGAQ